MAVHSESLPSYWSHTQVTSRRRGKQKRKLTRPICDHARCILSPWHPIGHTHTGHKSKKRKTEEEITKPIGHTHGVFSVPGILLVTYAGHKSKKRKTEEENDEEISAKVQMNIVLPSSLKKQLVSDWEYITKDNLLVPLPRTPTVKVLLQQYLEEVGGEHKKDTIQEVVQGIQAYFDKALANILLYKEERDQCDELLQNSVVPSDVYGAEHLLRLFIKLPELLPYKSMEEATVRGLEKRIAEVTTWLQRNEATLFVLEYVPAEKGKKSEPAE